MKNNISREYYKHALEHMEEEAMPFMFGMYGEVLTPSICQNYITLL